MVSSCEASCKELNWEYGSSLTSMEQKNAATNGCGVLIFSLEEV
jgi:hypothetical protein